MSGTVLKVAGIVLAVWLVISVIGTILATVKFFFMVGLVALAVMLAVTLVAKTAWRR